MISFTQLDGRDAVQTHLRKTNFPVLRRALIQDAVQCDTWKTAASDVVV